MSSVTLSPSASASISAEQKEQQQRAAFFEAQEQIAYSIMRELVPNLQLLKMNFLQRVDVPLTKEEEELLLNGSHALHHAFQFASTSILSMLHNEQTLIKTAADLQRQGKLQFQTAADLGGSLFEELQLISQRVTTAAASAVCDTPEGKFAAAITSVVLGRLQNMIQRINEEVSMRWDAEAQIRKEKLVPMDRLIDAVKCQRRELDQMRFQRDKLARENEKLKVDLENSQFRLKRMTEHRYDDYSKFFKELQQVRRSKGQPRENELFVVESVVTEHAAVARRIGNNFGNIRLLEVPLSVIVQHGDPDAEVPASFGGISHDHDHNLHSDKKKTSAAAGAGVGIAGKNDGLNHHTGSSSGIISGDRGEPSSSSSMTDEQNDTLLSFEDMAAALKRSVELEKQLADFKFVEAMGIQNSGELISTLQHHQKRSHALEDRNSKLSTQVDKLQKDLDLIKSGKNKVDKETEFNASKDLVGEHAFQREVEVQTDGKLSLVAEDGVEIGTETETTLMDSLTIVRATAQQQKQQHQHQQQQQQQPEDSTTYPAASSPSPKPERVQQNTCIGNTLILSESQFLQMQKPETSDAHTQTRHAAFMHAEMQAAVQTQDNEVHAVVDLIDEATQVDFYKDEMAAKSKDLTRTKTYHAVVGEDLRADQKRDAGAHSSSDDEQFLSAADLLRRHGCSEESPVERDLFADFELGDAILMQLHGCGVEDARFEQFWNPMEDNRPDEMVNPKFESKMRTSLIRDLVDHESGKIGSFIHLIPEAERHEHADTSEQVQVIKLHGCSREESRSRDYDADGNELVDLRRIKIMPIPNDCNGEADRRLESAEILDRIRFHTCEEEAERVMDRLLILQRRREQQQQQQQNYNNYYGANDDDSMNSEVLLKPMNVLGSESARRLDQCIREERFFDQEADDHKKRQGDLIVQQEARRVEVEEKRRKEREEAMFRAKVISEYRQQQQQAADVADKDSQTDPVYFSGAGMNSIPFHPTSSYSSLVVVDGNASRQQQQQQQQVTAPSSSGISSVSGFSTDDDNDGAGDGVVNPIDRLARQRSVKGGEFSKFPSNKGIEVGCQTTFVSSPNSRRRIGSCGGDGGGGAFAFAAGISMLSDSGGEELGDDVVDEFRRALDIIQHFFKSQPSLSSPVQASIVDASATTPVKPENRVLAVTGADSFESNNHSNDDDGDNIPYLSATRSQREHLTHQMLEVHKMNEKTVASKRRSAEISKKTVESLNAVASKLDSAVLGAARGVVLPAIEFLQKALVASKLVNTALEDVYENSIVKTAAAKALTEEANVHELEQTEHEQEKTRHLTTGKDYSVLARARRNRKVAEAEVKCWDAISQIGSTVTKVSRELQNLEHEFGTSTPMKISVPMNLASTPSLLFFPTNNNNNYINNARNAITQDLAPLVVSPSLQQQQEQKFLSSLTPEPSYKREQGIHARAAEKLLFQPFCSTTRDQEEREQQIGHPKTPPPLQSLPPLSIQISSSSSSSSQPQPQPLQRSSPFPTSISSLHEKIHGPGVIHGQHAAAVGFKSSQSADVESVAVATTITNTKEKTSKQPVAVVAGIDETEASQIGLSMIGIGARQLRHGPNDASSFSSLFPSSSPQQIRALMKKRLQQGNQ